MNTLNVIYHLARADFLERTRRYSFMVTLVLTVLMAYSYVPSHDANYITLSVDGARGVYNSAWVGSLVAILSGITLPLIGFFLVKNAIERDTQTRVGQIMATTPLKRPVYTLGKWLSNFAVLALITGMIGLAAIVLQIILNEDRALNLLSLLAPIFWVVLPSMALISALAVLFETVGWLRGGLGNIVYLLVCTAVTMASFMPVMLSEGGGDITAAPVDVFGVSLPLSSMLQSTMIALPNIDFGNSSIGPIPIYLAGPLQTFVWAGIQWTPPVIVDRLVWIAIAIGIVLLAALFFNRFDPARERRRSAKNKSRKGAEVEAVVPPENHLPKPPANLPAPRLAALDKAGMRFDFWHMLLAELRLLRKGLPWWWFLVAAALIIAGLLLPSKMALRYLLPFTWLWPVLVWSALGTREARHNTGGIVFTAAHPLGRQLPAIWLAGVLVTALTGIGIALNLLFSGDIASLAAWGAAVLFIPSLALALAVWSGSSKLFEVVYVALWYLGPLNQTLPQLDFMGTSGRAISSGVPLNVLITTGALIGITFLGRQRKILG